MNKYEYYKDIANYLQTNNRDLPTYLMQTPNVMVVSVDASFDGSKCLRIKLANNIDEKVMTTEPIELPMNEFLTWLPQKQEFFLDLLIQMRTQYYEAACKKLKPKALLKQKQKFDEELSRFNEWKEIAAKLMREAYEGKNYMEELVKKPIENGDFSALEKFLGKKISFDFIEEKDD